MTTETPDVPAGGFSRRERIANVIHLLVIGAQDEAETVENIERTLEANPDAALIDRMARALHDQQTFDAECYASTFDAPDCPCRANIAALVEGRDGPVVPVSVAVDDVVGDEDRA